MFRSAEIAIALTEAWIGSGTPNKGPKEVADFYLAIYGALEEAKATKITQIGWRDRVGSINIVVQLICGGIVLMFIIVWVLLAMFAK